MQRRLGNVLLMIFTTVFALAIAEGILRMLPPTITSTAGSDRGYFSHFDLALGWAPTPRVSRVHVADGFSVFVQQNSNGLRAPESFGPRRSSAARRVLVLGDSYVWGYGAEQDDIFTSPRVVGRNDVELINFGVSGYGTDQELLWYRRLGQRFEVDEVVLVFTTYNDVSNNLRGNAYGYDKPYFTLEDGSLRLHAAHIRDFRTRRWWQKLRTGSRVVNIVSAGWLNLYNFLLNKFAPRKGVSDARNRILAPGEVRMRDRRGLDLTAAIIRQLRDEVTAHGAAFSVIFVPYKPHVLARNSYDHPLAPLLAERLEKDGIMCYEPYALFLDAATQGQELFNLRDNHFNAAGHALFSEVLADPELRQQLACAVH